MIIFTGAPVMMMHPAGNPTGASGVVATAEAPDGASPPGDTGEAPDDATIAENDTSKWRTEQLNYFKQYLNSFSKNSKEYLLLSKGIEELEKSL